VREAVAGDKRAVKVEGFSEEFGRAVVVVELDIVRGADACEGRSAVR
jgi:hypothetical protein